MTLFDFCTDRSIEVAGMKSEFETAMDFAPSITARAFTEGQLIHDLQNLYVLLMLTATSEGLEVELPAIERG